MTLMRWVGMVVALLLAHAAYADAPKANCVVSVIHASDGPGGIDPQLERVHSYLVKAPFSTWKQFKLLESKQLALAPKATEKITLPNGKIASLTFVEHMMVGKKHRLRTQLEITEGEKKLLSTVFALDEGGYVLQAGQHFQNGLLILAISCETKD